MPLYVPGRCSLQAESSAELQFTISNGRATGTERLLNVSSADAERVRMSPTDIIEIPPGTIVAAGQPGAKFDPDSNRQPLEIMLLGIDPALRPGSSTRVTFEFSLAGDMPIRVSVGPCPAQP